MFLVSYRSDRSVYLLKLSVVDGSLPLLPDQTGDDAVKNKHVPIRVCFLILINMINAEIVWFIALSDVVGIVFHFTVSGETILFLFTSIWFMDMDICATWICETLFIYIYMYTYIFASVVPCNLRKYIWCP